MRIPFTFLAAALLPLASAQAATPTPSHANYLQACQQSKADTLGAMGWSDVDADVQQELATLCQCEFDRLPPAGQPVQPERMASVVKECAAEVQARGGQGFFDKYAKRLSDARD